MDDEWRRLLVISTLHSELYGHTPGVQLEEFQLLGDI